MTSVTVHVGIGSRPDVFEFPSMIIFLSSASLVGIIISRTGGGASTTFEGMSHGVVKPCLIFTIFSVKKSANFSASSFGFPKVGRTTSLFLFINSLAM